MSTYVSYPCKKTKIGLGNQRVSRAGATSVLSAIKGVVGFFATFAFMVGVVVWGMGVLTGTQAPSADKEREFWRASRAAMGVEEAMTVEMIDKGTTMTPAEWREWMHENY